MMPMPGPGKEAFSIIDRLFTVSQPASRAGKSVRQSVSQAMTLPMAIVPRFREEKLRLRHSAIVIISRFLYATYINH